MAVLRGPGDRLLRDTARREAWRAGTLSAAGLASTALTLLQPAVLGKALDQVLRGGGAGGWVAVCAALVAAQVVLAGAADLLTALTTASATARLRRRAIRHVLDAGPPAAGPDGAGDLVTRLVGNASDAGGAPAAVAVMPGALVAPLGAIVALGLTDPWLAVAFLAGAPALALLVRRFARASTDCVARYQQVQGAIAARFVEALAGARTIAAAGTEQRENARVLRPLPELSRQGRRMWAVQGRASAQAAVLVPLLQVLVTAVAGVRLAQGALTVGGMLAATRYALLATGIGVVVGQISGLVRARTAAARLSAVLSVPAPRYGCALLADSADPAAEAAAPAGAGHQGDPAGGGPVEGGSDANAARVGGGSPEGVGEDPSAGPVGGADGDSYGVRSGAVPGRRIGRERACGTLELRGVTVVRGEHAVLDGVELTVPGGLCVAVVGRSGSGKSLLAAVAGRLADPDRGEALLDGRPLASLSRRALRRAVGFAFERPVLFGGTVEDAVAFGPDPVPHERVTAAARAAGADGFVRLLPEGYGTARERAPLSGGENQRLGLARAFAHAERLLVLDDATSSLDTVTELQVTRALSEDPRRRTRLVVTHRIGTAARADLVAWLDDGRIRALAPHADLWHDAAYRALFAPPPPTAPADDDGGPRPLPEGVADGGVADGGVRDEGVAGVPEAGPERGPSSGGCRPVAAGAGAHGRTGRDREPS